MTRSLSIQSRSTSDLPSTQDEQASSTLGTSSVTPVAKQMNSLLGTTNTNNNTSTNTSANTNTNANTNTAPTTPLPPSNSSPTSSGTLSPLSFNIFNNININLNNNFNNSLNVINSGANNSANDGDGPTNNNQSTPNNPSKPLHNYAETFELYGESHPSHGDKYRAGDWIAGPGDEIEILKENTYLKNGSTNRVLEIEANGGDANVYRDFATGKGEKFTLNLDYSVRKNHEGDSAVDVYWEGNKIGMLNADQTGMKKFTFDVIANAANGMSRLEFRAANGDGAGGVIDNIILKSLGYSQPEKTNVNASPNANGNTNINRNSNNNDFGRYGPRGHYPRFTNNVNSNTNGNHNCGHTSPASGQGNSNTNVNNNGGNQGVGRDNNARNSAPVGWNSNANTNVNFNSNVNGNGGFGNIFGQQQLRPQFMQSFLNMLIQMIMQMIGGDKINASSSAG